MASKKETFLLVSLNEDKAKELAQVVSNDTSRKILDYLAENEATESEMAKALKLPISTVHYNLQHLMKGGLVVVEEYHYSEKGREVNHYKLANKYIIIAPKSTWGLKQKLRKILPALGFVALGGAILHFISRLMNSSVSGFSKMLANTQPDMAVMEAASDNAALATDVMVRQAAPNATLIAEPIVQTVQVSSQALWQYAAFWFLVGGFVALLVFLIADMIKSRKK